VKLAALGLLDPTISYDEFLERIFDAAAIGNVYLGDHTSRSRFTVEIGELESSLMTHKIPTVLARSVWEKTTTGLLNSSLLMILVRERSDLSHDTFYFKILAVTPKQRSWFAEPEVEIRSYSFRYLSIL
jgi:hypothetical protein